MAKQEKRFTIHMSLNNFLDKVIEKSDVRIDKHKEIITLKDKSKITLHKKLQNENKLPNKS